MIELDERLKIYDRRGFFGRWHLAGGTPKSALLGSGSSGSVYVVRAEDTNEVAALKIIPIDESNPRVSGAKSANAQQIRLRGILEEVKTEINIMNKLRGMNRIAYFLDSEIVKRTDTELESWDVLIRLQKLIPLKDYLQHRGLEPGMVLYNVEALRIWRDMSEALLICENKGVIHADVKPQNILFSPDNDSYMLSDFGVSLNDRRFDESNKPAGTPPYMAPEMLNRQGGDNRVDMYSLAATIYKMLNADKLPPLVWDEKGKYSSLRQPVPRIKGIPAEINDVLIKCLAEDPNQRYDRWSDVKEITNALYVKYINGFETKEPKGKKWAGARRRRRRGAGGAVHRGGDADGPWEEQRQRCS